MYKLGRQSTERLKGVHPALSKIVHDVMSLQVMDFSVAEGLRSIDRQKELYASGKTRTMNSKHIVQADGFGHAVDLYPYPIQLFACDNPSHKNHTREIVRFGVLAGLMLSCAKRDNIRIVWGADWNADGNTIDHSFFDAPHFQIEV